jgi:hypothetical protein
MPGIEESLRTLRDVEGVFGGEELESAMLRYFEHKLYVRKMAWGFIGILSDVRVNLPALRMAGNLVARRIDPEVAASVSRPPAPRTPSPPSALPRPSVTPPPPPIAAQPVPPKSAAPPPPEAAPPVSERQARMYRGRRIEE